VPDLIVEARIQDEDIARVISVLGADVEASVTFCIGLIQKHRERKC